MERVRVAVQAPDPISAAGLTSLLCARWNVDVLPPERRGALRRAAAELGTPVVLVVDEISRDEVLTAVECRVVAVVPRTAATSERLQRAVEVAATGGGVLPVDMVGELIRHVARMRGRPEPRTA